MKAKSLKQITAAATPHSLIVCEKVSGRRVNKLEIKLKQ